MRGVVNARGRAPARCYLRRVAVQPFSLRKIAVAAFGPSLLFGLGEGAILPAVPLAVRALGGSVSMAALVVTLLGLGALASNLPASLVTTRWGERRAIVGASLWGALGMLLALLAPGVASFAAGIVMVGMSAAVFGLARMSYLTGAVPIELRARALSTLGGVMRIGLFIGPFAAAGLMQLVGLAGAWWVGIAALLASALLAARLADLPGDEDAAARAAGGAGSAPGAWSGRDRHGTPDAPAMHRTQGARDMNSARGAPARTAAPGWRSILAEHRRVFLTVGTGVVLISAVRAARQAIIPLWAVHIGLDAAGAALVYGLSSAIDMLVFYPAGKLMDTRGRRWAAVPCMALMGVALLAMPFTASATPLLLAALLLGFGNGLGSGIVMTLGADHAPARGRAHFLGVWRLLSDIGGTAGPALLSLVTAVASLAAGIGASGALALLGAALLARWIPHPRRGAAAPGLPSAEP